MSLFLFSQALHQSVIALGYHIIGVLALILCFTVIICHFNKLFGKNVPELYGCYLLSQETKLLKVFIREFPAVLTVS